MEEPIWLRTDWSYLLEYLFELELDFVEEVSHVTRTGHFLGKGHVNAGFLGREVDRVAFSVLWAAFGAEEGFIP